MNLTEIHSFRQMGRRLRNEREARGLTLPAAAGLCGMTISELVRIENGELLGFKQVLDDAFSNAETYAKALDVKLDGVDKRHSRATAIKAENDEVFIPAFLRKK